MLKNTIDDLFHVGPARLNGEIRLGIGRASLLQELPDSGEPVRTLQKGTTDIGSQPLQDDSGLGHKANEERVCPEVPDILGIEHGAAACGNDTTTAIRHARNQLSFSSPETGLPLRGKDLRNRHARRRFYGVVQVDKWQRKPFGQTTAYDGFPCPHEPGEHNLHVSVREPM